MTGQNQRGFDIEGGAVGVGGGRMRSVGQGGLLGEVQGVGFGVGVDIKLLWGRTEGVRQWGRAVAGAAGRGGGARGDGFRAGGDGTRDRGGSGVEVVVGERVGGAEGEGGGGGGVRGRRPLLLGGGIDVTGVGPIGRGVVGAAMIET